MRNHCRSRGRWYFTQFSRSSWVSSSIACFSCSKSQASSLASKSGIAFRRSYRSCGAELRRRCRHGMKPGTMKPFRSFGGGAVNGKFSAATFRPWRLAIDQIVSTRQSRES